MNPHTSFDDQNLIEDLIKKAKTGGAHDSDCMIVRSISLSHSQRLGKTEKLERQESYDLSLRVINNQKQAIVSSTDLSISALDELVERALAMANSVPEDPWCGIAESSQLASNVPALEMEDPEEPSNEVLVNMAQACEEAAMAIKGITNSDGAEAGWSHTEVTLGATNGFSGNYSRTDFGLGISVIAGKGTDMESDNDYSQSVFFNDLENPEIIGANAGKRAVSHLGAKKMPTSNVPVVFDPRTANSLLGHLAGAINGSSVARGTSFLKDQLDKNIFSSGINIIDDPHMSRGLRSKPFDGEGLENTKISLVQDGVLMTWLLDLASSRQLGLNSNGRASRSLSAPPNPSPTNIYLEAGNVTPDELIADISSGFYITSLMGMGVNGVTGDYSRGASGFWIENGEITFPVTEMTIAGNLKNMYQKLVPANDLKFRYGTNSPTLRIDGLTVAGSG